MENRCKDCAWAKEGPGMSIEGNTVIIARGNTATHCTAGVIRQMDFRNGYVICSSFKPKEGV